MTTKTDAAPHARDGVARVMADPFEGNIVPAQSRDEVMPLRVSVAPTE